MQVFGEDSYIPEQDKIKKQYNHYLSTLFCLGLFLSGFLLLQIFGYFFSIALENLDDIYLAVSLSNFLPYVATTIISLLILYFASKKNFIKHFLPFKNGNVYFRAVYYSFGIYLVSLIWGLISQSIATSIGLDLSVNTNQSILIILIQKQPIITGITVVLLGPLLEELTYRYGLFEMISRKNKILAFILTSLIFGFIHFDFESCFYANNTFGFYLESFLIEILNIPSYILSGTVLCYAYYKEDNIATPFMAHVYNNALSYILILLGL